MRLSVLAVAAGLLSLPLAARADLTGDTVHVTFDFPYQATVFEDDGFVVVPGSTSSLGEFTISLSGSQITVVDTGAMAFDPVDFDGFVLTDVTQDPMISGVSEDAASTLAGVISTSTTNSVALNFEGLSMTQNEFAIFNLSFANPPAVTPEPSSFALLGTGLLGVAGTMRRRFSRL